MRTRDDLFVFLDESGNGNPDQPLLVGAVACDRELSTISSALKSRYLQLRARPGFQGMSRYDEFVKEGFHRSDDPYDVQASFIELLITTPGYKMFMVMTDRTTLTPDDETTQLRKMYEWLGMTLRRNFKHYATMQMTVENNDALRPLLPAIAEKLNSRPTGRHMLPRVSVSEGPKSPDSLLAISDYMMGVSAAWIRSGGSRDAASIAYRQFRDIEGGISLLYSLEQGVITSRRRRSP
jgi:hypothetical protein